MTEIESVFKSLATKESHGLHGFTAQFYQMSEVEHTSVLHKPFSNVCCISLIFILQSIGCVEFQLWYFISLCDKLIFGEMGDIGVLWCLPPTQMFGFIWVVHCYDNVRVSDTSLLPEWVMTTTFM